MIGPTSSTSRRVIRHWLFVYLLALKVLHDGFKLAKSLLWSGGVR